MIVIGYNGARKVISGWREWIVWIAAAAVILAVASLALGVALTLLSFAVLALPVLLILALIVGLVQRRR